jgi:mRNA interferase ChpB
MQRGEVWMVNLEPTVGNEIRNDPKNPRPVIILSTAAFCTTTGLALIVPITIGGMQSRNAGYAVALTGFGLQTAGVVRCEQLRSIDLTGRAAKYVETAPDILVEQILGIIDSMIA